MGAYETITKSVDPGTARVFMIKKDPQIIGDLNLACLIYVILLINVSKMAYAISRSFIES